MPTCILGMHRSGTSMIARLLNLAGLDIGPDDQLYQAHAVDNPEGYWENIQFVDMSDELLALAGGTWREPPPFRLDSLPEDRRLSMLNRAAGLPLTLRLRDPWGWKDPRATLTLPFWQQAYPDLKVVICLRNPLEVAHSMSKRQNDRMDRDQALRLWIVYHEAILSALPNRANAIVTHYDSYFYDPAAELARVNAFLGLPTSGAAFDSALASINLDARRNITPPEMLQWSGVLPEVIQHYMAFCAEAGPVYAKLTNDLDHRYHAVENALRNAQGQVAQIDSERRAAEQTQERLRADLLKQQNAHDTALSDLLASVESRFADLQTQAEDARAQIDADLASERDLRHAAESALEAARSRQKTELDAIRQQVTDRLEALLLWADEQAEGLNASLLEAADQLAITQTDRDRLNADLDALRAEYASAQGAWAQLVAQFTTDHDTLKAEYDAFQTSTQQHVSILRDTIETFVERSAEFEALYNAAAEARDTLDAQLTNLQRATDSLQASHQQRLEAEAALQNRMIQHYEGEASALRSQAAAMKTQFDQVNATLGAMRGTRSWRWIEAWWRLKRRLFPAGTIRWRLYHLSLSALVVLLDNGVLGLADRAVRWLRGERRYYGVTRIADSTPPPIAVDFPAPDAWLRFPAIPDEYALHLQRTDPSPDALRHQAAVSRFWSYRPLFSIITPIYQPPMDIFRATCQSVITQTYSHWQWVVVDASPGDEHWRYLTELASREPRIKPVRAVENLGISANTNIAFKNANGDFIVMLDHDDVLTPDALYEVTSCIHQHPDADLIYSDEDKLDEQGRRCEAWYKPDWSPDMMVTANLITHLAVIRRSLLDRVGYLNPKYDGAQDWDLYLRLQERTEKVYHVAKVLYQWRKTPTSTAASIHNKRDVRTVQRGALQDHLDRLKLKNAQVVFDDNDPIHSVHPLVEWDQAKPRKISIVIPSKDQPKLLGRCLSTLFGQTTYADYEVILVDTGSVEPDTTRLYRKYESDPRFRVVNFTEPFNFSKACNVGASAASGDLLLFLNNDVEITHADWLDRMAQWYELDGVGIVGALLFYPNRTIQHAGVIAGMGGFGAHVFSGYPEAVAGIFGAAAWVRDLTAVTGACLMIDHETFDSVGRFDEDFTLNYSDIDLCMKVNQSGRRVVFTPGARLIHHESATSRRMIPRGDFELAYARWGAIWEQGDPYFNRNLSYLNSLPHFNRGAGDHPHSLVTELMRRLPNKPLIELPGDLQ